MTDPEKTVDYINNIQKYNRFVNLPRVDDGSKKTVVRMDVYDVLLAFNVVHPAIAHAIKKLLMPGNRGAKSFETDLKEAIIAIQRAIEMQNE